MNVRCAYCYYKAGTTKDHIVPRSLSKFIGTNSGNIVPACPWCNSDKSDKIFLPTVDNIHGIFKYFTNEQLYEYAVYCYMYVDIIESFIQDEDKLKRFNAQYGQFLILYKRGYFDDLDSHRIPDTI